MRNEHVPRACITTSTSFVLSRHQLDIHQSVSKHSPGLSKKCNATSGVAATPSIVVGITELLDFGLISCFGGDTTLCHCWIVPRLRFHGLVRDLSKIFWVPEGYASSETSQ
jgi:hypothetical protein